MPEVWDEFYSSNRTDRDRVNKVSNIDISIFNNNNTLKDFVKKLETNNRKSGMSIVSDTRDNSTSIIFDKLSRIKIDEGSDLLNVYKKSEIEKYFNRYHSFTKEEFLLCYNIYILLLAESLGFLFETEYEKNSFTEKRSKFVENILFTQQYMKIIQSEKRLHNIFSKYIVNLPHDTNPLSIKISTAMYDTENGENSPQLLCAFSGKRIDPSKQFFIIELPNENNICVSICEDKEFSETSYVDGMYLIISSYFSFGYLRGVLNNFAKDYNTSDLERLINESLQFDSKVNTHFIEKFLQVILLERTVLRDIFQ